MPKRFASVALRVVAVSLTGAFVVWGVRWREVVESLRNVDGVLLSLVVAANACMMAVKAIRLRLLLGPRRASFGFCFLALLTSSAINNVAPLRGGDVARLWMLSRNAGISKAAAMGVTIVEKLVDSALARRAGHGGRLVHSVAAMGGVRGAHRAGGWGGTARGLVAFN